MAEMGIQVEEISTWRGLAGLRGEWTRLCERCPWATPFQRPEWLLSWCRSFPDEAVWAMALRHEGRLVGLAPCCIRTAGSLRELWFAGAGISDYLDMLLEPDLARSGASVLFEHLGRRAKEWDIAHIEPIRPESPLFDAPLPPGWRSETDVHDRCPVLNLPPSSSMDEVVPAQMLRKLARYRRRAAAAGALPVELATPERAGELIEALFRLHGARWAARGLPGVLAGAAVMRFHREVASALARAGMLRMHALHVAGRIIAVMYGFLEKGRALYYLSGFDPRFSRLCPGTLLIGHAIENAVKAGLAEVDFLRGREQYKYAWGAEDRMVYTRTLWHTAD